MRCCYWIWKELVISSLGNVAILSKWTPMFMECLNGTDLRFQVPHLCEILIILFSCCCCSPHPLNEDPKPWYQEPPMRKQDTHHNRNQNNFILSLMDKEKGSKESHNLSNVLPRLQLIMTWILFSDYITHGSRGSKAGHGALFGIEWPRKGGNSLLWTCRRESRNKRCSNQEPLSLSRWWIPNNNAASSISSTDRHLIHLYGRLDTA